jgi:hypothetical protein
MQRRTLRTATRRYAVARFLLRDRLWNDSMNDRQGSGVRACGVRALTRVGLGV